MLMTMTAANPAGRSTRFEQRMDVPAHGFLDIAASLDRAGMKDCLSEHLTGGRLRSALSQARSYALPRLMIGIADGDTTQKDASFTIDQVKVDIRING